MVDGQVKGAGIKAMKDPFTLITMLIGVVILVQVGINLFPLVIGSVVLLGNANTSQGGIGGDFTFLTLFTGGGLFTIILSAIILVSVLALFGIRARGGR